MQPEVKSLFSEEQIKAIEEVFEIILASVRVMDPDPYQTANIIALYRMNGYNSLRLEKVAELFEDSNDRTWIATEALRRMSQGMDRISPGSCLMIRGSYYGIKVAKKIEVAKKIPVQGRLL